MRPSTSGHRPGGRNRQFFTGLSGLARGITAAADRNRMKPAPTKRTDAGLASDTISEAHNKRQRKDEARARAAAKTMQGS